MTIGSFPGKSVPVRIVAPVLLKRPAVYFLGFGAGFLELGTSRSKVLPGIEVGTFRGTFPVLPFASEDLTTPCICLP